ncbi:synaptogenesis protein syg-2-like isoform X1 [Lytechinus variegatus]|uniref:synaptogenesis protein syg-2-like isoform X1 n=1 Tax=Lytechinus variegatus TaxID=7654 RepID=UPI001BB148BC|nr:synaptogenesis protein syg-2-like isoform X1 [Lytechinus variegatus]
MAYHIWCMFALLVFGKGSPSTMSTATISFQRRQFLPVKGEDFTMKCTYFPPSNDRTVKWKHEETRIASEWCTTASECTPNISNPTKYKLMGDDRSTSLTIINLNTGDNGRYTCTVFNLHGERSTTEILKVLTPVPPSRVFMSNAHSGRQYLNNANISITAGESLSITCGANRARPPAVLQWLVPEDVTVVHQDQSDVIQDGSYISRKALTITPTRDDHGKILSCIASHPEIQRSLRSSVLLNVHVLPSSVLLFLTGGNQSQSTVINVQEDSPTSITCKSIGSFPATELSFWLVVNAFERSPILANVSSNRSILDDTLFDTESTITIRPDATKHGIHIVCSSYMDDAFFVKLLTARLVVYGLPVDVTISIPGDMFEGAETNITCRALNGYPAPLIHWYIGSRNLTDNSSLETSLNAAGRYDAESTLTLIPMMFDQEGRCH